ncbi:Uncharacterised protein [Serratia fonticola]|nr:Uncharacterised protein [Serratia fonticola]
MTTTARVQSRLKRSKSYVFTRDDFKDPAGYDQIGRALRELIKEGLLLKSRLVYLHQSAAECDYW